MNTLQIATRDGRRQFFPGDEIEGTASWQLGEPAKAVELRLFWYTRGKGTTDAGIVDRARFDHPAQTDEYTFRLKLPDGPYSFSGKLISLIWALELVVEPSGEAERLEFTVSPTGKEIVLSGAG